MIGTVLLVLLCVKIAKTVKARGRKAAGFVWAAIGLCIGGGMVGFCIGALCSWQMNSDVAMVLTPFGCALLFELGAGFGAYCIAKNCKPGAQGRVLAAAPDAPAPAPVPAPVAPAKVQAEPLLCVNCGERLADGAKFCTSCGTPVQRGAVTAPEPAQATEPEIACETIAEPMARAHVFEAADAEAPVPAPGQTDTVLERTAASQIPAGAGEPEAAQTEKTWKSTAENAVTQDASASERAGRKPGGRGIWFVLAGAAAVLALVLILSVNAARKKNYEAAVALFDAGGYQAAAKAFDALGKYEDVAERAETAREEQRKVETFTRACELARKTDSDSLTEAEELFRSLGNYEDAAVQAEQCRYRINYSAALQYESEGSFEEALAVFTALGSYEDAAAHARTCSDTLDYTAAMTLFEAGEYEDAAKLLIAPAESGFSDAAEQLALCNNKASYAEAEALFDDGEFYAAYEVFSKLGSFEDASARAQSCVQPTPGNGELYHNEAYAKPSAHLRVVNSGSSPTLLKLYAGNGDLVSTFFILGGKSVTVKVPGGNYSLNQAYGSRWFGEKDMFGDDGEYYECEIEGSKTFTLKSGYIATISRGSGGTPVVNSKTGRSGF